MMIIFERLNPLPLIQKRLELLPIRSPRMAHSICRIIPAKCPFKRTITFGDRPILNIPALCQLNPLYDQLMSLRFRALTYLADQCGEDVSFYCS